MLNQEPMTLEQFRTEARYAWGLLELFQIVRGGRSGAVVHWIISRHNDHSRTPTTWRILQFLGSGPIVGETLQKDTLYWGQLMLENLIEPEIAEVRHTFLENGQLGLTCPDFRTALYWQFACLVGGKRPIDFCEGCGNIFTKRRQDQKCCDSTCRSRKSRRTQT